MEALILLLFLPLVSCLHALASPEERELMRREREASRLYAATWGQLFGRDTRSLERAPELPAHTVPPADR